MRQSYLQLCQKHYLPLHFQPWWLDAVCGAAAWQVVLATDKNGTITGVMPYYQTRRWGLKVIQLPPLTAYAGPWLFYPQEPDFKANSRLSFEKKVLGELLEQLPRRVFFKQNFRPEISNWLPFYWKNFKQSTRYTYRFEAINDLKKITAGFKNTLRSDLKKAAQWTEATRDDAQWATVFALNQRSFQRKKLRQPYGIETFQRLHTALNQRNQSACFIAWDKASGRPSAGLYLVFDKKEAAVLLTGTEPDFKNQCAVYSLFMEAIRFCAEHSLSLDFEGSMDENIERSFRAFGGRLTPYFQITRWG